MTFFWGGGGKCSGRVEVTVFFFLFFKVNGVGEGVFDDVCVCV